MCGVAVMSKMQLLRRLLAGRKLQHSLAVFVMACSVALAVCVLLLAEGLHSGITQAGKPFPLLMGAKGSPNQLVLNSVFLKDQPVGNISYTQLEKLRANKLVAQAVPLGFGDNYKGYRIVGTGKDIFSFQGVGSKGKWLQLAAGKAFAEPGEAVVGAETAAKLGLKLGDTFASVHGLVANANAKAHKEQYKVVGILKPVKGPYDNAIFVSMESIWQSHVHHDDADKEITAVLIRPKGYAESMQLAALYSKDRDVQLIFPSKTIIQLFSIMGNMETLLRLLSGAVLLLALLIIGSSLYWLVLTSLRQQAVMRALGASAAQIGKLYVQLGMTLVAGGLLGGLLLGHGVYALLSLLLQQGAGLYLPQQLLPAEGALAAAVLLSGLLCSVLPVWLLSRRDVANAL